MTPSTDLNTRISTRANAIKGIAIVAIILYHYFRAMLGRPNDLQWAYISDVLPTFGQLVVDTPAMLLAYAAQFFGYLGVPLFFILSDWGLAYAQQHSSRAIAYGPFLKRRLLKLLPMYYLSLFSFAALYIFSYRHDPVLQLNLLKDVALKTLLLHNLFTEYTFSFNSVYWFLPTLVTLYLLFPLLYTGVQKQPWISVSLAILLSYGLSLLMLQDPISSHYPAWAMGAFPLTRLSEFVLGIALAGFAQRQLGMAVLLAAGSVLLTGGLLCYTSSGLYPLHNLLIGSGMLCLLLTLPTFRASPWQIFGALSFPLFLFHRPFISPWLGFIDSKVSPALGVMLYLLLMLFICWLIQQFYRFLSSRMMFFQ